MELDLSPYYSLDDYIFSTISDVANPTYVYDTL